MSKTGSASWRFEKSLIFLFAFVPLLQWVPCFVMNGHIRRKKWLMEGFAYILMILVFIISLLMANSYEDTHLMFYPEGTPMISDYLGENYYNIENYDETPEYAEYLAAYDAFTSTDEYLAVKENNRRVRNLNYQVHHIAFGALLIGMLLYAILIFFVERYKYLDALAARENRNAVYGAMSGDMPRRTEPAGAGQVPGKMPERGAGRQTVPGRQTNPGPQRSGQNASGAGRNGNQAESMQVKPANGPGAGAGPGGGQGPTPVQAKADGALLNVNTATEDQIAGLPGISIIDAKKIMDYRSEKGSFRTMDEFFASFSARPHIIVRLEPKLTLRSESGQDQNPAASSASATQRKRFDI